jgi:hypothetical protein
MKSISRGQVLGPWKVPKMVLNVNMNKDNPPLPDVMLDEAAAGKLAQKVRQSMLKIKAQNMAGDGMSVAYDAISTSDDFAAYKTLCGELCSVDPAVLAKDERKAFFINVYNALTVHAIIEGLCKPAYFSDTLGRLRLYASAAYNIGGVPYSLNDIENGGKYEHTTQDAPRTPPNTFPIPTPHITHTHTHITHTPQHTATHIISTSGEPQVGSTLYEPTLWSQ